MVSTTPTLRGFHAIGEVVARMEVLAEGLRHRRPPCETMTLRRRDLDLIRRWPKAAELHEIFTTGGVTHWRGFELRADRSPPRYLFKDADT